MKVSEILTEAREIIADQSHWSDGGWVGGVDANDEGADKILTAPKVCAVTAVARVCMSYGLGEMDTTNPNAHVCNCEYCAEGQSPYLDVEGFMIKYYNDHPCRLVLNEVALALYDGYSIEDVNDNPEMGHAAVMRVYELAIERAKADEAVVPS